MAALSWLTERHNDVVASGRSQLVAFSQPIAAIEPLQVLPAKGDAIFWQKADLTLVAGDTAHQITAAGGDRFAVLKQYWQTLECFVVGDLPARAFIAFSFFDQVAATAPFPAASLRVPRWLVWQQAQTTYLQCYAYLSPQSDVTKIEREWRELAQQITATPAAAPTESKSVTVPRLSGMSYREAIRDGLAAIATGELTKVVIAHAITLTAPQAWQAVATLAQLRQLYPDCTIFSWQNRQNQTFLGASPESLVTLQHGWLRTEAIAGSAPRGATPALDHHLAINLLDSEKEQREHQVVVTTIVDRLHQLGIAPAAPLPPQIRQLSTIQHLHSTISAPTSLHLLDVMAALHPTPAVAGAPADPACHYIAQHESFERGLYAAPLGWMDQAGNGDSIVAIRSALLNGQAAHLYAGAGVVAGSDPDREWAEVQLKLQVLLKALR